MRKDDIGLELDQLGSQFGQTLDSEFGLTIFEHNVLIFRVAELS